MFTDMQVTLIDSMGTDLTVVNAARVSFDKEVGWDVEEGNDDLVLHRNDVKLINYLAFHNHWTPFAHCTATFRIKAPIFVARQLMKSNVGFVVNEISRRYVDNDPEFYLPSIWRGRPVDKKQGSSGAVDFSRTEEVILHKAFRYILIEYRYLIEKGIAPEQARMILPQNMMTEWYWTGSLAAYARMCKLRLSPDAQFESQIVASFIADEMLRLFPVSWQALVGNINE